jgi:hypothetical protein
MSNYFRVDALVEADIRRTIGRERLAPYLASAGSLSDALTLYVWNSALAAAFLVPLASIEVALRNAIVSRLEAVHGAAWYDDAAFLALDPSNRTRANIATAKQRIARAVPFRPVSSGRVVAELPFSFWVYLLRPALNRTLWPSVRPAFMRYAHRKTVVRYAEPLVPFRNRVAHHEPIFDRRPRAMYEALLQLADVLSENLRAWVEHNSRVQALLADGPFRNRPMF